jgi:hypothetical protein
MQVCVCVCVCVCVFVYVLLLQWIRLYRGGTDADDNFAIY